MKTTMVMMLLLSMTAFAGDKGGNGGDGIILSNDEVRFLDLIRSPRTTFLDIEQEGLYTLLKETLEKHPGFNEATHYPQRAYAQNVSMSVGDAILEAAESLTFKLVSDPIPEVNDRGMVVLPWNVEGKIVRLALQDRNSSTVIVSRELYEKLQSQDRVALLFHEALIRVWYDDTHNSKLISTEQISTIVNVAMTSKSVLSPKSVARYLCSTQIMADEKSNFGLRPIANFLVYRHPDSQLPSHVTSFIYDSGRCEANILVNDSSTARVWYNPTGKAIDYSWSFTDVDGKFKFYFTDSDEILPGGSRIYGSVHAHTTKKSGISLSTMNVNQLFDSRFKFWK